MLDVTPRTTRKKGTLSSKGTKQEDVHATVKRMYSSLRQAAVQYALPAAFHSGFQNKFKVEHRTSASRRLTQALAGAPHSIDVSGAFCL